jgi:hypothetical protein
MALFSEGSLQCARKLLDTADIVREAILRQLFNRLLVIHPRIVTVQSRFDKLDE